jgi:amino acid transporter
LTIIGLIISGIIISAGGGPNHKAIGFKFWNDTGGFQQYQDIGEPHLRNWEIHAIPNIFPWQVVPRGASLAFSAVREYEYTLPCHFTDNFAVLINAAFAFIGSEITAIAAAETSNVRALYNVTFSSRSDFGTFHSPKKTFPGPSRASG